MRDQPDRPEVIAEILIGQVGIGDREVAFLAPNGTPRISDQEGLLRFIVADGEDRVSADDLF